MSTFLSPLLPKPLFNPYPYKTRTLNPPFLHKTHLSPQRSHLFRAPLIVVAKFGFLNSGQLPDPQMLEGSLKDLFGKVEGLLYTIADVTVANSDVIDGSSTTAKQNSDWLSGITSIMETVLKVLKDGLSTLHVPYSYGFAIILLTVLVKTATFPLSKKQVESAMAMRSLQPQIKAIQKRYAGNQEKIQIETARLYKVAGINPFAGCLPTLATIPVWIGLYRALSNVANEGLLTEGFFWIPSLAGPTAIASRQNGSGISWLFPFVDGHPPLGWSDTAAYLVLPVLLVVSQYISVQVMQSSQPNDPNVKSSQVLTKFLPLMIGYFALSVPSGLSLYWFTNNILSTLQQLYLQKMGGANTPLVQFSDDFLKEQSLDSPPPKPPVLETKLTQTEEKSPSTGLRPGERFKQLKEEEARKKRLREEEMMKKEATSNNVDSRMALEQENRAVNNGAINGNVQSSLNGHQDASVLTSENGRLINETDDGDKKEDLEDRQKETVEVTSRLGSMDFENSGEETLNS